MSIPALLSSPPALVFPTFPSATSISKGKTIIIASIFVAAMACLFASAAIATTWGLIVISKNLLGVEYVCLV